MKEWNSPYNPFNSMKVLLYSEQLQAIADQKFMPPIVADSDPTNRCNYNCIWCNAYDVRKEKHTMTEKHLLDLADFYKEWGIKSTCVAGGGEPLMNPAFNSFLERLHKNGIEIGVITNGSLMTDEHIETIARTARWCGFSMDAATAGTYCEVKGIKDVFLFGKVLENIKKLRNKIDELGTNCDIGFKYLLHPLNAKEIYDAVLIAKDFGAHDFHLRPVGWDNLTISDGKEDILYNDWLLERINRQIEEAMKLETQNFHVYGIRHKFNPNLKRKVNFKKCRALPLLATFGADGNVHLCFDRRGDKDLILCKHDPDPREILKVWGSEFHKDMMNGIDPEKCPRCTFGAYNEIIEKVFLKDNMCRLHI